MVWLEQNHGKPLQKGVGTKTVSINCKYINYCSELKQLGLVTIYHNYILQKKKKKCILNPKCE